jgi:pimeloyl-ACP methyl ester carboxylesterase
MFCLVITTGIITLVLIRSMVIQGTGYVALATDRQDKVRINSKLIATYTREACAHALFTVLNPIGRFYDPSRRGFVPAAEAKLPLIIIADLGWRSISLWFLRTYLQQRGWETIICVSLDRTMCSLADLAEQLQREVAATTSTLSDKRVVLIGHGVGGLVAAWYSQHLDSDQATHRLISLGTAWRGSKTAIFSSSHLGAQLTYKAPVLDDLHPTAANVCCISSKDDPTIVPEGSAAPEFHCQFIELEAAAHMELLMSARAFRGIRACLEGPIYQDPDDA